MEGYDVTYLPVQQSTGRVDMEELKAAMRDNTILVSVMAVNNEIGTLQPLKEIGELCRSRKIVFHCDAAQMLGKMPIRRAFARNESIVGNGPRWYRSQGNSMVTRRTPPLVRYL